MTKEQKNNISKPRHIYFYELLDEAFLSLNQLNVILIPTRGIEAVSSKFKFSKTVPAFGSLRFDKDQKGRIFLQEFRPGSSAIKGGYFYSFQSERPFWEIVGTLLARLNKKRKRHLENIVQNFNKSSRKNVQYCLIMQGGLNKEYIQSLLEQGRVTYNTHNEYLQEGPLFSALSILSKLSSEQIIETEFENEYNLKKELVFKLARLGRTIEEIACVVGKSQNGDYYTSNLKNEKQFPVQTWTEKVIPVNIAACISDFEDQFINKKGLLILDKLTFNGLLGYLQNRENFIYKTPKSAE